MMMDSANSMGWMMLAMGLGGLLLVVLVVLGITAIIKYLRR